MCIKKKKKTHCVWYNSNNIIFTNLSIHYNILIKGLLFLFSENWKHTSFAAKRFCWMFTKCSTLEHTNNAIQHYFFFFLYNIILVIYYDKIYFSVAIQTMASLICDWTGCVVPVTLVCVVPRLLILRIYLWNAPCTSTFAKQNNTDTQRPCRTRQ